MIQRRRGFALLAVLWVMAGASVIAIGAMAAARASLAAARGRAQLTRAEWRAEECAEQARAVIGRALDIGQWDDLDRIVASAHARESDCEVKLRAAGARLDINKVDDSILTRLLSQLHVAAPQRDSLVAALRDWIDADDTPRPLGAEREWYAEHGRSPPRNGPLADIRELCLVRGFDRVAGLDSVLDVEPGPVAIERAPVVVIASLPGFDAEAVARVVELRGRRQALGDPLAFSGGLGERAREDLLARFSQLAGATSVSPVAWILTSRATLGTPKVTAVLELKLVRSGTRAAIVRRRTWIE